MQKMADLTVFPCKTRFGKNISYFSEKRKGIPPTFLSVYQESSQNKHRSREGSAPHRRLLCTLLRILLPGSPPPGGTSRLITRPPQQRKIHLRFPTLSTGGPCPDKFCIVLSLLQNHIGVAASLPHSCDDHRFRAHEPQHHRHI